MKKVSGKAASSAVGTHHEGNFQTYFAHKIAKLDAIQNVDSSLSVTGIFKNCTVFVNGRTVPPLADIRRLVVSNGGNFQAYHTSAVTHVVCDHFTDAELKQDLKTGRREKVFYVTARWITESIDFQKRQSESNYPPKGYALRFGRDISFHFHNHQNTSPVVLERNNLSIDLTSPPATETNQVWDNNLLDSNVNIPSKSASTSLQSPQKGRDHDLSQQLAQQIFHRHFLNGTNERRSFEIEIGEMVSDFVDGLVDEGSHSSTMVAKGNLFVYLCELLLDHDLVEQVQILLSIIKRTQDTVMKNTFLSNQHTVVHVLSELSGVLTSRVCHHFGCMMAER